MGDPQPLSVALAGAGPWAQFVHAPVLAAGPETRLTAVWSRTAAHAEALADQYGATAVPRFEDLLDRCEAVAFCVPPAVQPGLAITAARAGKGLLLEKPLAVELADAEALAAAVGESGVGSVVVLTNRFSEGVRSFLAEAASFAADGGRSCFYSGALLEGPFAQGWRLELGALLDIGPHAIDLIDAALGPVTRVQAHGAPLRYVGLLLDHESGAVSEVSLSGTTDIGVGRTEVELFGPAGSLAVDARDAFTPDTLATLRREFAETVRTGAPHPCDVHRGLHLQRLIAAAEQALASA